MKKIIKSDKFTYSWMVICNTVFSWTAQFKNESLKTVVICSIVFLSAIVFGWVASSAGKTINPKPKKGSIKLKTGKKNERRRLPKNIPKYS